MAHTIEQISRVTAGCRSYDRIGRKVEGKNEKKRRSYRFIIKNDANSAYFTMAQPLLHALAEIVPHTHRLRAASLVPPLLASSPRRKGEHGKLLIVGGSQEYSGAPFYSGHAALLTGADLVWVACAPAAATPLKSLSPELIVLGVIPEDPVAAPAALAALSAVLPRVHCVVVGPGLGRAPGALAFAAALLQHALTARLPTVVDGDGLFLLSQRPELVRGHPACILTPNSGEWERLRGVDLGPGIVVLRKGEEDEVLVTGAEGGAREGLPARVRGGGCPRRCGGQGDVLAGAVGTFLAWGVAGAQGGGGGVPQESLVAAACGGAALLRAASSAAFEGKGRAMLTPDVLGALGGAFERVFGLH